MWSVGLIFWLVGIWVVWMRPKDPKTWVLFFLFMSFTLFWALTIIPPLFGMIRWIVLFLNAVSFTTIPVLFLYFFLIIQDALGFI